MNHTVLKLSLVCLLSFAAFGAEPSNELKLSEFAKKQFFADGDAVYCQVEVTFRTYGEKGLIQTSKCIDGNTDKSTAFFQCDNASVTNGTIECNIDSTYPQQGICKNLKLQLVDSEKIFQINPCLNRTALLYTQNSDE